MQFKFFFPIFFLSLPRNFDLKKNCEIIMTNLCMYACRILTFDIYFCCFFAQGAIIFVTAISFFFCFFQNIQTYICSILGKKNIFFYQIFFWKFLSYECLFAVNVCVQIYFLMQFFLYYPLQKKTKTKLFLEKATSPFFQYF